jgi:hypothetical protein
MVDGVGFYDSDEDRQRFWAFYQDFPSDLEDTTPFRLVK